jgi:hypothetical protein
MKQTLSLGMAVAALGLLTGCQTDSTTYSMAPVPPPMVGSAPAYNPAPAVPATGLAARIIQASHANAAQLQHYSWSSRVELLENGVIEDIRIDLVALDPYQQWQRTLLNDQSAPLPEGFIRRRIAENERAQVETYLTGLRGLLDQYTMLTSGQVVSFVSQAQISAPDANGLLELTGGNVVMPGDSYSLWLNPASRQTRRIQVTTFFQLAQVQLTASFATLSNGLTHVQYAEVDVPAQGLRLQMHNFDYNPNN